MRLRAKAGKLCRITVGRTMLNALPSVSATLTQSALQATSQGRWKKLAGQQKPEKCVVVASFVFAVGVLLATWPQLFVPIAVFLNQPTKPIISRSVPGAGLHATVAMNVRKLIGNRSTSTSACVRVTDVAHDACQELKKSKFARCSLSMVRVSPAAMTCIYCSHDPLLRSPLLLIVMRFLPAVERYNHFRSDLKGPVVTPKKLKTNVPPFKYLN